MQNIALVQKSKVKGHLCSQPVPTPLPRVPCTGFWSIWGVFLLRHHLYGTESALSSQIPLRGLPGPPQAAGPPRALGPGALQPLGVHVLDPVSSSAWGRRAVAPPGTAERVALPAPRCACPGQSRPPPRGPPALPAWRWDRGAGCGDAVLAHRPPAPTVPAGRRLAARPVPCPRPLPGEGSALADTLRMFIPHAFWSGVFHILIELNVLIPSSVDTEF